jgi:hypothetical protein
MSIFNSVLVIAIKRKAKYRFRTAAKLVYILQKKASFKKVMYSSNIYYHTKCHDSTLRDDNVAPISEVRRFSMLILLTLEN